MLMARLSIEKAHFFLVVKLREVYDYIEHDLIKYLMRASKPIESKDLPCRGYARTTPCSLKKNAAGVQAEQTAYRLMANSAVSLERFRAGCRSDSAN